MKQLLIIMCAAVALIACEQVIERDSIQEEISSHSFEIQAAQTDEGDILRWETVGPEGFRDVAVLFEDSTTGQVLHKGTLSDGQLVWFCAYAIHREGEDVNQQLYQCVDEVLLE